MQRSLNLINCDHTQMLVSPHIHSPLQWTSEHMYVLLNILCMIECRYRAAKTHWMLQIANYSSQKSHELQGFLRKLTHGDKAFYEFAPLCIHEHSSYCYLHGSFPAKKAYNQWLFFEKCGKYVVVSIFTLQQTVEQLCICPVRWPYRVAQSHRVPYLYRSFSAKEPHNQWLFCTK